MDDTGSWMGGGGYAGVRDVLYISGACGTSIRVVYVDHIPTRWGCTRRVQPLGGTETHIWKLHILHYHQIIAIYYYPFFGGNHPIVILDNNN